MNGNDPGEIFMVFFFPMSMWLQKYKYTYTQIQWTEHCDHQFSYAKSKSLIRVCNPCECVGDQHIGHIRAEILSVYENCVIMKWVTL